LAKDDITVDRGKQNSYTKQGIADKKKENQTRN